MSGNLPGGKSFPDSLITALRQAGHIAALTGAGISAESGVPTFRDAQTGMWARFRPEELATAEAFRRNPQQVWEWYAWRRGLVAAAAPNLGHRALAELEKRVPRFTLITQNVDGLHERAGSGRQPGAALIELHGNIQRVKCFDEGTPVDLASLEQEGGGETSSPPRCRVCGAYLRPDVVWFGEMLPADTLQAALEAAGSCDVFFSIGTSGLVEPAASLPFLALQNGAVVVEVNPNPTPLTEAANYALLGPSGVVLPALLEAVWPAS